MKKLKKYLKGIGIIGVIILIVMGTVIFGIVQQSAVSQKIYTASLWGNLACVHLQSSVTKNYDLNINGQKVRTGIQGLSIFCGQDEYTDKCDFKINYNDWKIGRFSINTCNLDNTNCQQVMKNFWGSTSFSKDITILKGQKVYIEAESSFLDTTDITITKTFYPYVLISTSKGAFVKTENPLGCNVPTISKQYIRNSEYGREVFPNEPINFLTLTVNVPEKSILYYTGKQVSCTAGFLYELYEEKMADGTLLMFEKDSPLVEKDCCPGMIGCNADFTWTKSDLLELGTSCSGQLDPLYHKDVKNINQVCQYQCINKVVTAIDCKPNECLNCQGTCSSDYKCYTTGQGVPGINDKECASGQIFKVKSSTDCGFLCQIGLSQPTIVTESYCATNSSLLYIIIGGALFIIFILLITQPKIVTQPLNKVTNIK